jgi:hypothetical protein
MIIYAATPYRKHTALSLALSCSDFQTTPAIPTALEIKPANSVAATDTRRANQEAPLGTALVANRCCRKDRNFSRIGQQLGARHHLPSRRMTKKIREFLGYTPPLLVPKKRGLGSYCWKCGISAPPSAARLRRFASNLIKAACNHKFMQLTPIKPVRLIYFNISFTFAASCVGGWHDWPVQR